MPHIEQLSPHVADLIAAGEVVERPASVVKELMENAIDAGAKSITVEIHHGGMTYIRVTDDGCGIPPEEAASAFLRHATSKLRTEYDLEAIGTLGFRGEALAAICAVAQVELLTRTGEAGLGTCLTLEGGEVRSQEEAGCPKGTTMIVRSLFYNTPARLKFMKKDAAEGAACCAAVQRAALSHPEICFKLLRDGRQELLTPGDGALQSALYAVLGRDLALGFTPVKGSGEDLSVQGFVSRPACCRGTRGYQFFFVNGRCVKSRTMTAALEEAYANQKMVGKFPGCALHLTCKLSAVDVNVHPTKQEVKFGAERKVFEAVYYAVRAALEAGHIPPSVDGPEKSAKAPVPAAPAPRPQVPPVRTALPLHDRTAPGTAEPPERAAAAPLFRKIPQNLEDHSAPPVRGMSSVPRATPPVPRPEADAAPLDRENQGPPVEQEPPGIWEKSAAVQKGPPAPPEEVPAGQEPAGRDGGLPLPPEAAPSQPELPGMPPPLPWRMVGEVLHTYIIVEQGDQILFIDKHAAHERLNFDRLRAESSPPMVQTLLTPLVFTPPPEEGAVLLAHRALLEEFGFGVEDFGGGTLLVRFAPAGVEEIETALTELAGELLSAGGADPSAARDALLHTMACRAAIKGGQKNAPEELLRVAGAVLDGSVKYCPHGRPVAVSLTRAQLERRFGRA